MRRISGTLDITGSAKYGPSGVDRNSTQNQLIFSQSVSEEETDETLDNADNAILRTLYRRNRLSTMSEHRFI